MSERFVLQSDNNEARGNQYQPAVFSAAEVYGERRELNRG